MSFFVKQSFVIFAATLSLAIAVFVGTALEGTPGWIILMWSLLFVAFATASVLMVVYDFKFRHDPGSFWNGLLFISLALLTVSISGLVFMEKTTFKVADLVIPDSLAWMSLTGVSSLLFFLCLRKTSGQKKKRIRKMKQKPA